ncbi:MAG: hypothetical protein A3E85_02530 [Gammaproteobacteria bacterium RIFCSPHIGHO2_12_FULL_45_12]|nr:MAG: hypothetical protein A3E85_02530 [Gammaproteobacteria bacterium RIFCSPHIGHO2_12_FULL_45_12]
MDIIFMRIFPSWLLRFHQRTIRVSDIFLFLKQFTLLMTASISMTACCDILLSQQTHFRLRSLIRTLKQDLLAGKSLSHSLSRYPHYFGPLTFQLIQLGEHTGNLGGMLTLLTQHHDKQLAFRRRLKQALFYPCLLTVFALLMTDGMFIFIIPRFEALFHEANIAIPALTALIFHLANGLQTLHWLLILPLLFLVKRLILPKPLASPRPRLQHMLMQAPLICRFFQKLELTRFIRHLAITYSAGIAIVDALILSLGDCHHSPLTTDIATLRRQINAGHSLHQALASTQSFPPHLITLIKIGETSGSLDRMLHQSADLLESDLNALSEHMTQLLEPLIMLVLGVLIGGLVLGLYLPIFTLGNAI